MDFDSTEEINIPESKMPFQTEEQLIEYTKGIVDKTFKEIDTDNILSESSNDKGILGKVVETGFYGYETNTRAEADFAKLGIELKVSGFTTLQDGTWSAKERLSLSSINYKKIIHEEYEFSKLISKNRKLLIIWYEYIKGNPKTDFKIRDFQLYDMEKDEDIIKNDFYTIKQKVVDGLAHELSEGDTVILGAATKGQSGQTSEQPNSPIRAATRGFSLKNSFFRGVLRSHKEDVKGELKEKESSEFVTPEEFVWERLKYYKGLGQLDILNRLKEEETNSVPNNISKMISDRVLGRDVELPDSHEVFNKSNFLIKNIPIRKDYYPIEKATFKTLHVSDFSSSWEESDWKNYFEEVTFIYIAYLGEKDGNNLRNGFRVLDRIFKVTFTPEEVDEFGKTYDMVKKAIDERDARLLPTASFAPDNKLVMSTKGNTGGAYERFFEGRRETCFMLNKAFLHKKFKVAVTLG